MSVYKIKDLATFYENNGLNKEKNNTYIVLGDSYSVKDLLKEKGIDARVVSMPSFELFEAQDEAYKESVLPKAVRNRVAVEAASSFGWHKYVGLDGEVIAIDHFGASAPAGILFKEFGFTVENVVETALRVVNK